MSLLLIALMSAALSGQNDTAQPAAEPEADAVPGVEVERETPPETRRVCRYVRVIGSSVQRRVCSDQPTGPRNMSTMHSTWEAQSNLRRMQGSRLPDGS